MVFQTLKKLIRREKSIYKQIEYVLTRAKQISDEQELNQWSRIAADLAQYAIYEAEQTGDKEFTEKIKKEARLYQFRSYNPLESEIPFIRDHALKQQKRDKISDLEKIALDKLRFGIEGYEEGKQYYFDALELAKELNDPQLMKDIKARYEETASKYIKRLV